MKSKDLIYIGLLGSLFYLAIRNKHKVSQSEQDSSSNQEETISEEESTGGGGGGAPGSNEPEQIFGMGLPPGIQSLLTNVQTTVSGLNPRPKQSLSQIVPYELPAMTHVVKGQTTLTQDLPTIGSFPSSNNVSECGNNFSITTTGKTPVTTNYWYDGTYYYMQTVDQMVKSVPVKISFTIYNKACVSKLKPI
jgi:hypothetical protein